MSEYYRVVKEHKLYFLTCTVVGWMDVFTRHQYFEILNDSLNYCIQEKGLKIHGYVFMTNHIHLLASSGGIPLNKVIKSFKQFTAGKLLRAVEENGQESRKGWMTNIFKLSGAHCDQPNQFWHHNSKFIALWNPERIRKCLDYIHQNPVKAGFVDAPEKYLNSSAGCYINDENKAFPVECLQVV